MSENQLGSEKLAERGLKFTKIYLVGLFGGLPVAGYFGIIEFHQLKLNEVGDFLAGAFGPLAIFWLVLGFFQQGKELRNSVEALKLQVDELKNSVQQQKAMVGITEKQLELDITVREEQNSLLRSKELPLFQIRSAGNASVSNSKNRRYRFSLKNIGADAATVSVHLNKEGVLLRAPNWAFTERGAKVDFEIETQEGPNFPDGIDFQLTIESTNIRDQIRKQVFTIGNFQPMEVSCDPAVN